jgi:Na+/glutamate symporter
MAEIAAACGGLLSGILITLIVVAFLRVKEGLQPADADETEHQVGGLL